MQSLRNASKSKIKVLRDLKPFENSALTKNSFYRDFNSQETMPKGKYYWARDMQKSNKSLHSLRIIFKRLTIIGKCLKKQENGFKRFKICRNSAKTKKRFLKGFKISGNGALKYAIWNNIADRDVQKCNNSLHTLRLPLKKFLSLYFYILLKVR